MFALWRELKKIIGQIQGSQNIFGYKSTVANQMYLYYCFSGKIFFSSKMDSTVKHLWFVLVLSELTMTYILTVVFFLYDEDRNIIMMLNAVNIFGCINVACFGASLISYICDDDIEAAIELIDHILTIDEDHFSANSKQNRVIAGMKNIFAWIIGPMVLLCATYLLFCVIDVGLFFSEDKLKNSLYYTAPIPSIKQNGTLGWFFFMNAISAYIGGIYLIILVSMLALMLYWNTVCCTMLIDVRNECKNRSRELMRDREKDSAEVDGNFNEWNRRFHGIVQRGIESFQEIILLINHLKIFVEVIGSFVTPVAFLFDVAVLYICLSEDLLFVMMIKFVAATLSSALLAFVFYWIGQNLENSIGEVATAVYSTPWYYSVKMRKKIHLFLCQTQSVNNFSIIKVYGLLFKNFSRYLNGVMTYVNLLRRLTLK